ncbi:hypothetical protein BT93_E1183 [Corymbia citriodora subsp. variegata]|nr:hypothetical protein BT93_E1183 [Corymbia citriodora subsp. variegata]
MYTRLSSPGDNKGTKLTAVELDSISYSFDESLRSPLSGLSPASASLPWFLSAVGVLSIAHSAVRSLIYELELDGDGSLLSWYLDNSPKVLDVCKCICSKIERLCLRHVNRRIAMKLLRLEGNPLEDKIHRARNVLADSEGEAEGSSGHVKSVGDIEQLIRDLAASIRKSALRGKVSPADRVVRRAVQAVNFLTAFVAGLISSALCSSSGAVLCLCVPKKFPWGDSVRAIESAIIVESRRSEERDRKMRVLKTIIVKSRRSKERDRKTRVLKELGDVEARRRHVLQVIDEVVASGGSAETVGRLRDAAGGMEKATEAILKGLFCVRDGVKELFLTVRRIRKEMVDDFTASLRKGPLPKKPLAWQERLWESVFALDHKNGILDARDLSASKLQSEL